jgi:hypothetical protein
MDRPEIRSRLTVLARRLGWLDIEEQQQELLGVVASVMARKTLTTNDVDFVCRLNEDRNLDSPVEQFKLTPAQAADAGHSAALACLGSPDDRARMMVELTSRNASDVEVAQVYFGRRPLTEASELRLAAVDIALMKESPAKVVALETLARHYVSDPEALDALVRAFPQSESVGVQRAIAGILLRSDFKAIARPELIRTLTTHRLRSPDGEDIIDVLIRRLKKFEPTDETDSEVRPRVELFVKGSELK